MMLGEYQMIVEYGFVQGITSFEIID